MRLFKRPGRELTLLILVLSGTAALGQERAPEDEAIDAIRRLTDISGPDQGRIRSWVQTQVDGLITAPGDAKSVDGPRLQAFRKRFDDQFKNANNTPPFRTQLAGQTATVATSALAKPELPATAATAITQVLVDMNTVEIVPGLQAALKSRTQPARYLASKGIVALRTSIAADKEKLDATVKSLKEAGLVETNAAALSRIYDALAIPGQVPAVLDAFLAVFDKRLEQRRGGALLEDGAEIMAWEFFRNRAVVGTLTPEQKADVARRAAVFLRMAAERYNDHAVAPPSDAGAHDISYQERDNVERCIDATEEVLELLTGATGGKAREELNTGGHDSRVAVRREAYKWVGDPQTSARGPLNEAPWNVPLGAP